jgi:hypothetical protein
VASGYFGATFQARTLLCLPSPTSVAPLLAPGVAMQLPRLVFKQSLIDDIHQKIAANLGYL